MFCIHCEYIHTNIYIYGWDSENVTLWKVCKYCVPNKTSSMLTRIIDKITVYFRLLCNIDIDQIDKCIAPMSCCACYIGWLPAIPTRCVDLICSRHQHRSFTKQTQSVTRERYYCNCQRAWFNMFSRRVSEGEISQYANNMQSIILHRQERR